MKHSTINNRTRLRNPVSHQPFCKNMLPLNATPIDAAPNYNPHMLLKMVSTARGFQLNFQQICLHILTKIPSGRLHRKTAAAAAVAAAAAAAAAEAEEAAAAAHQTFKNISALSVQSVTVTMIISYEDEGEHILGGRSSGPLNRPRV